MIELTGSCYAIKTIEKYTCQKCVDMGIARRVKDTSVYHQQTDGLKTGRVDNEFHVTVYHNYLINIKAQTFEDLLFEAWVSRIRIWYDERRDRAGIKITLEDLIAILKSFAVLGYLQKLNTQFGGGTDGNLDLNKLAEVLSKAAKIYDSKAALSIAIKND